MRLYLDASVLVALLTEDLLTGRAEMLLRDRRCRLVLSDFASAEFASVIARRVRSGNHTLDEARAAFAALDQWSDAVPEKIETIGADIRLAEKYLRRLDVALRPADAVNVPIAARAEAVLATFDARMMAAARILGLEVATA